MNDGDWDRLLTRVESGYCTPFLGAGACYGTLPLGGEIAKEWAEKDDYPLSDSHDLARVAQFVGVKSGDPMWPKEKIQSRLKNLGPPDFSSADEPHGLLAALPLPIYMTTNYDDFMTRALVQGGRKARSDVCRWNRHPRLEAEPDVFQADPDYSPSPEQPLVYHLHGRLDILESLVLTEDDYLDFLVAISRDDGLLPHPIQKALAGSSLLFIGYRLADWDFRVLHRGLVMAGEQSLRRLSVTVQIPEHPEANKYLDQYFGAMNVRVFWGTAAEFVHELRERWDARSAGG
jgi:hypothetical protein